MPPSWKSTRTLLLLLTLSLFVLYAVVRRHRLPPPNHRNAAYYRSAFLSTASNATVAAYLRALTRRPHLAGTPLSLSAAVYVQSQFRAQGLTTRMSNFSALLSYPKHASVAARFRNGTVLPIRLAEPSALRNGVVAPYHAYSPSGAAYGAAVFLNYGREEDYTALAAAGAEVTGCVGIVRRGAGMSRHDAAANAAAHGVAAVLMYTEDAYEEGFERGTVMEGLGDPLTPGWAGIDGGEKLRSDDPRVTGKFPGVPSLPLSKAGAATILSSLEGASSPNEWRRIGRVGPGPIFINFTYEGELKMKPIHSVFAVIEGSEEPDRYVLLGNHRDAWTYGAVDPNSGTAALLDLGRRFSHLLSLGWMPRRTIVLCSWDAEEFGMIGSTEWVEQNIVNLGSKATVYFNVDCAVQGPGLFVSTTPQLDDVFVEVTKQVRDPDSGNILYEQWTAANNGVKDIGRLSRVDSDFAPFLHHAGVPSIDLYYGSEFPVYHTAFDSYEWMVKFGDPSFQRHVTVAGIWGLVALRLSDEPVLPFNYVSYAVELQEYNRILETMLKGTVSLNPISAAIQEFTAAAHETEEEAKKLRADPGTDEITVLKKRMLNDRLMVAERGFLDPEGLPTRQWFKHLIYGPVGNSDNKIDFFPGVANAMIGQGKDDAVAAIEHEIWRVARGIERAACGLRGDFSCR
ncbi:probable glutamate carboxypeptidase AMP1 [Andrographis paniculata]|uniref:probable glutamate carboxypeptidase AMP1 n=1 Tax=Andrographis paniculata TaxID=175694 RepID=UPI0021E719EA|nr:probable glutamate carboxypeptidase AMP1 [Andrographis paniculata]